MSITYEMTGPLPANLAKAIVTAIKASLKSGLAPEQAICVALTVVGDYGRLCYGDDYLNQLAELLLSLEGQPLPDIEK